MNCLNSILLEGNCVSKPEMVSTAAHGNKCEFKVKSYRKNPDGQEEGSVFDVEAYGRLGETIERTVQAGRGLRVVGRLKGITTFHEDGSFTSGVKIIAEHVEFKPQGVAS